MDQYALSRYQYPAHFSRNITFHSVSTNIGTIANSGAGGERGAKTGQSAY